MSLKQLIITIIIATALCWASWLLVIFEVDPTTAGFYGLLIFYASMFLSLLGLFFLIGFGLRKLFNRREMEYKLVGTSFRQSFFFAAAVAGFFFLQSKYLLTWWNSIMLIAALVILEFFFLSYRRQ